MTEEIIHIIAEEEGERLDKVLHKRFSNPFSRSYFQFLIDQKAVLLNGKEVKKRIKTKIGDEVSIEFLATPEIKVEPEEIPLNILFEDKHLIAINKPAGMVVHPAPGHYSKTFVNALLFHCKSLSAEKDSLRPGIVHRLDKETSGVLVAAKTAAAHRQLIELFSNRKVKKEYLAICVGIPKEGRVKTLIGRHPKERKKMTVLKEGPHAKEAISTIEVLYSKNNLSLVKVILETGRTHQIRVHLKHLGAPIVGDPTYGSTSSNKRYGISRQLLHAETLSFQHPITGIPIELMAEIPSDMKEFIKKHTLAEES